MSNTRQETVADIVADMRQDIADGTVGIWADFGGEVARGYADRIEKAYKRLSLPTPEQWTEIARQAIEIADLKRENDALERELEAGAEAAQICGEIGELIGREATSEKSSAVGNAAAMRETLLRCDAMAQMPEIREYTIIKEMRSLIKGTLLRSGEELR